MSPLLGELLGTMILIMFGNGAMAGVLLNKSKAQNSGWIVLSAGWSFGVMSGVFVAQATGSPDAHINPAVTVASLVRGELSIRDAITYIAGQLIGAFIGATLVWLNYLPHWGITTAQDAKLACFCTGPAIRNPLANIISEIIGTFALVFVIFSISGAFQSSSDQNPATNLYPYLLANLVWGIGLALGGSTGYAINPVRDLGPRIAHAVLPIAGKGDSDWGYAWIPVVAPLMGSTLAALLALAIDL